jgi:tRNA (guanine37-N1)-methyltransferase
MKFDVLTLFPEMFEPVKQSIIGRATSKNILEINLVNMRDFSEDKHKHVDDTPYGGGAGMLMKPDVVYRAYKSVENPKKNAKTIYLTPQGKKLNQKKVEELAKEEHLILLCGHYEGIDERVIEKIAPEEISIGDYVLTGGELPAMVLIDSVSRYVSGVLSKGSTSQESFEGDGLLEYPQYTKPEEFEGIRVPEVLISGHHKNIDEWRRRKALENTYKKRPELLKTANLNKKDREFLEELETLKNSKK